MTTPSNNGNNPETQAVVATSKPFERVVVHPLVLLSVVDHFNRMKQVGNTKRVVGVLLGSLRNKIVDISNSFAGMLADFGIAF
jgi:hypothetical protein